MNKANSTEVSDFDNWKFIFSWYLSKYAAISLTDAICGKSIRIDQEYNELELFTYFAGHFDSLNFSINLLLIIGKLNIKKKVIVRVIC